MNKRILSVIVFGAALLSVQAQDGKGGISPAMLGQIQQSYQGTPSDKALRNAIGNNDIRKLALNQENMQDMDTHFSIKVDSKGITDQKSSGRCWLFTGLNVMRAKALARYGFPAFEFSEIYPFFWDQLEKSNLFLSLIHISEPTRQAEISYAVFCLKKKKKRPNKICTAGRTNTKSHICVTT